VTPVSYKYDEGRTTPVVFSDSECLYGEACNIIDLASSEYIIE